MINPPSPCADCPQREHAPQTVEEIEAWRVLTPVPPCRHAGMAGVVVGVDMAEIAARVDPAYDVGLVVRLAMRAETSIVEALKPKGGEDE